MPLQGGFMFKHIGHVAIRAKDIEVTASFYCDMLGMKEAFRMNNGENGKLSMIYLFAAPGQFIEIFPDGTIERQYSPAVIGVSHFCIEVDNIEDTLEKLRAAGIPVDQELKTGASGCKMFWTHDPDGNRIEFMELTPDCLHIQALNRLEQEGRLCAE